MFFPILYRFNVSECEQPFVMAFYLNGIIAIIVKRLENDCAESIDFISDLIVKCVNVKEI